MVNDVYFLSTTLDILRKAQINTWVFGGWAEELWAIAEPRSHNDIDLLYPAENFDCLDTFILAEPDFIEIEAKRFSHKRAVLRDGIMIEFFLVQSTGSNLFTAFFNGQAIFDWPSDILSYTRPVGNHAVNVASQQALIAYRANHENITLAYIASRNLEHERNNHAT